MTNPPIDWLGHELARDVYWDEGVDATRNVCVAGAPLAAAAITAAAWYDNPLTGSRAMLACMERLESCPLLPSSWVSTLSPTVHPDTHDPHYSPGFGFVEEPVQRAVQTAARHLVRHGKCPRLQFWLTHREVLTREVGGLNVAGLCALGFLDHGVSRDDAERHFLLWRMEPALAAAQTARARGFASFPFFQDSYVYEGAWPTEHAHGADEQSFEALRKAVGLEP